ncbi:Development/cell death domain [Dillenia turbinata]|uniref:Development/cell death domain n=1 Tax=Dillenia turbinata TaxID=194707 RepID=A0AAN8UMU3_9MAGN
MAFDSEESHFSGKVPEVGAIFIANCTTKKECMRRKLFGLPSAHGNFVKQVKDGMILFLFEYEKRRLYGVFQACSAGAMNIVPHAYSTSGKQFAAQVSFTTIWHCDPLSEEEFRDAIRENYYAPYKFNLGLSKEQVYRLLTLFGVRKLKDESSLRQLTRTTSETSEHNAKNLNKSRRVDGEKFLRVGFDKGRRLFVDDKSMAGNRVETKEDMDYGVTRVISRDHVGANLHAAPDLKFLLSNRVENERVMNNDLWLRDQAENHGYSLAGDSRLVEIPRVEKERCLDNAPGMLNSNEHFQGSSSNRREAAYDGQVVSSDRIDNYLDVTGYQGLGLSNMGSTDYSSNPVPHINNPLFQEEIKPYPSHVDVAVNSAHICHLESSRLQLSRRRGHVNATHYGESSLTSSDSFSPGVPIVAYDSLSYSSGHSFENDKDYVGKEYFASHDHPFQLPSDHGLNSHIDTTYSSLAHMPYASGGNNQWEPVGRSSYVCSPSKISSLELDGQFSALPPSRECEIPREEHNQSFTSSSFSGRCKIHFSGGAYLEEPHGKNSHRSGSIGHGHEHHHDYGVSWQGKVKRKMPRESNDVSVMGASFSGNLGSHLPGGVNSESNCKQSHRNDSFDHENFQNLNQRPSVFSRLALLPKSCNGERALHAEHDDGNMNASADQIMDLLQRSHYPWFKKSGKSKPVIQGNDDVENTRTRKASLNSKKKHEGSIIISVGMNKVENLGDERSIDQNLEGTPRIDFKRRSEVRKSRGETNTSSCIIGAGSGDILGMDWKRRKLMRPDFGTGSTSSVKDISGIGPPSLPFLSEGSLVKDDIACSKMLVSNDVDSTKRGQGDVLPPVCPIDVEDKSKEVEGTMNCGSQIDGNYCETSLGADIAVDEKSILQGADVQITDPCKDKIEGLSGDDFIPLVNDECKLSEGLLQSGQDVSMVDCSSIGDQNLDLNNKNLDTDKR